MEPYSEPTNAALEAEIDRDPSDANYLVYADWLQQAGNPRGELIASDIARKTAVALDRTVFAKPIADLDRFAPKWRAGYLDRITIATTRAEEDDELDVLQLAEMAGRSPAGRFLRELELWLPSIHENATALQVLSSIGKRPTLRKLTLLTDLEEEMLSWTTGPDIGAPLAALFPNLEVLELHAGTYDVTAIDYPRMTRLTLRTCRAPDLTAIVEADWPALEHLELWFGSASYGVELPLAQLTALLERKLPKLKSLSLSNGEKTDELVAVLVRSPLLKQLDSLAITGSTMTDEGGRLLLEHAKDLAHITSIDVDDNYLSEGRVIQLKNKLRVHSSDQREVEQWDEGNRYASVGE
ncbi:MAG: TIGR02996 domain-containing protein [Kofleriaceae bacterium]